MGFKGIVPVQVWLVTVAGCLLCSLWLSTMLSSAPAPQNEQPLSFEIVSPQFEIDAVDEVHLLNEASFEPWKRN